MVGRPQRHISVQALAADETIILDLTNWRHLQALPDDIGLVASLESLCLAGAPLPWHCACLKGSKHETRWRTWWTRRSVPCAGCDSIATLPDSVGQLRNLRDLDLTGCFGLQQLPETVGALQRLTNLQMPQCTSLRGLPESVGLLTSLATLNAGDHPFAVRTLSTPCCYFESPLSLDHSEPDVPSCLGGCVTLNELPAGLGGLGALQKLDLFSCAALSALPQSFGHLASLLELDLSNCTSLQSLPTSFGKAVSAYIFTCLGCVQGCRVRSSFWTWSGPHPVLRAA